MKKNGNSIFNAIAFYIFVVWGIGTLINIIFKAVGFNISIVETIEKILKICAILVMLFYAYTFYSSRKNNKLVFWLFWTSVLVAVAVLILPFIL